MADPERPPAGRASVARGDAAQGRGDATGSVSLLRAPTAAGARRIFIRFVLVAVGINAAVGAALVAYNVASSMRDTEERLVSTGQLVAAMVGRLRRAEPGLTDGQVVQRAARLAGVPMALLARDSGEVRHASDAAIPRLLPRVYPDRRPRDGARVRIRHELEHLSGGWVVAPLSARHRLLVVIRRTPEDEGLAVYMTIAAGLTGLGIALAFVVMLAAANWMLRRPLSRLVQQLTGALERDVERRRVAEERAVAARRQAEEHLVFMNSLIDASPSVGIVATDEHGVVQIINRAATRILGYPAARLVGRRTLDELRRPEGAAPDHGSPLRHASEGEEVWLDADGREHLLELDTSPIVDSDGARRGQLVTFIDVTEQRQLEAELQLNELQLIQSAKLATLGEMATGMAHELNQPLNNIGLLTSRLLRRLTGAGLDDETTGFYRDKLDKIRSQVERAGTIIEHLRDFGRPRAGQVGSVEVRQAVDNVMVFLREQLARRDIELQIDLPADLPAVRADEARLEQVLMNLILNARDAMVEDEDDERPRRLVVAAHREQSPQDEPGVCIEVGDTGPGMPREVLDRVFEPFFTTKEVGKGTGLGLSISYGLIREFGGTLSVDSAPGEGTTFCIHLPAADGRGDRST